MEAPSDDRILEVLKELDIDTSDLDTSNKELILEALHKETHKFKDNQVGCTHYARGCLLKAPCCGILTACRVCHDEKTEMLMDEEHKLVRKDVETIVCVECLTEQPIGQFCTKCNAEFGHYFCEECRLFDHTDKKQFHCDGCKICRVGPKENYFHCDTCGYCLLKSMRDSHSCVQEAINRECPVCMLDMFECINPISVLDCGHCLHQECYNRLIRHHYRCPVCQKPFHTESARQMYRVMEQEKRVVALPDKFKEKRVKITCNDCTKTGGTFFHFVGLQCEHCGSFNTCQTVGEAPAKLDEVFSYCTTEEIEFLDAQAEQLRDGLIDMNQLQNNLRGGILEGLGLGDDDDDDDDEFESADETEEENEENEDNEDPDSGDDEPPALENVQ
eukprot:TRINITY_DN577_c0_g2_i1.p1 TRINITY_DN577_c0_g2~~TRINITY_DN577_c0_g2_i1.p1  ORF type:complete len:388 (+),score=92.99 TRINITY_DN577_c0_g2_i1:37-1200(+)